MKLRLRFLKHTIVTEFIDDSAAQLTVADVAERAQNLFEEFLFGEFDLSINNKDALEKDLKVVGDCDLVSGDLVYILPKGQWAQGTPYIQQNVENKSQMNRLERNKDAPDPPRADDSTNCVNKSDTENQSNCVFMDTEKPGTSTDVAIETEEEPVDLVVVHQCLSEPVLCREATTGTVPALLKELYEVMQPKDVTEAVSVVLHVLMLETGFTPHPEVTGSVTPQLPEKWQYGAYCKFTYTYPGCSETNCCLSVIPTGSTLAVHGKVVGNNDATRQCMLKPAEYVQSVQSDCANCFIQLAKLSMLFKDCIANPLVHEIRTAAGLFDVFGILALTQEIKLRIFSFLDLKSLMKVCMVNTELSELCKDPYLWRRLYLKHFGNRKNNSLSQDWKQLYVNEYKARKERQKVMSRMKLMHPPTWGPQNPFSGPCPWIPPVPGGIIGGDYDLYPNFPSGFPGVPGRLGPLPPTLPRPRYDLIGPGMDPGPDPGLFPRRPGGFGRGGGGRGGAFGGFGPRFF